MFAINIKFALRSLAKYKMYTLVNLLGLTLGITASLIVCLYIYDELSYDRFQPNADTTYQLILDQTQPGQVTRSLATTPAPMLTSLQSSHPEILDAVRLLQLGRGDFSYEGNGYYEPVLAIEPTFFNFFQFDFLEGSMDTALSDPSAIILTKTTATKYFGDAPALGKVLTGSRGNVTVSAVISDPPPNTHMRFSILTPFPPYLNMFIPNWATNWDTLSFITYVRLQPEADVNVLESAFTDMVRNSMPLTNAEQYAVTLLPLPDIHFQSAAIIGQWNASPGNITAVYTLEAVALFLILIACINYTNLATARSVNRAHEISLRKILGQERPDLILQLLAESVVLTAISVCVSLSLLQMTLPVVNSFTGKALTMSVLLHPLPMLGIIFVTLLIGVAAGAYPAFFLSRTAVLDGLKDRHQTSSSANFFRKLLVVTQFTFSVVLVFCTLVVMQQIAYIQSKPLGFDKSNVIAIDINSGPVRRDADTIKNELLAHPDVQSVSVSSRLPGDWKGVGTIQAVEPGADAESVQRFSFINVDESFLETYSIELLAGRSFEDSSSTNDILVNATLARTMGWDGAVGRQLNFIGSPPQQLGEVATTAVLLEANIIGVVSDFHYESLHQTIGPLVLGRAGSSMQLIDYYSVKTNGRNLPSVIEHLRTVMALHDPVTPLEYNILESQLENFYSSDRLTATLFSLSAGLAIFIACMGLFGLSSFTTEQRTKEIGIRKVLGATITNIVEMLSADFMKLVFVAIIIAWPTGYFLMNLWLQSFAYTDGIGLNVFLLSAILAVLVSMATVSIQSVRAAMRNPVASISYE